MPKQRKACGKYRSSDPRPCPYERMKGKQQCVWHWLIQQPADVQKRWADERLAVFDAVNDDRIARVPQRKWPEGERWCSGCQSFIPLFYCQGSRCWSCNSEAAHAGRIQKTYGITSEEYDALFDLQGGKCYICRRTARKRRLAVDHDHESGEVRGLLCSDSDRGCNKAILGNIRDLAMAKRIVEYLEDPPYSRLGREDDRMGPRSDVEASQVPSKPPPF